VIFPGVVRKSLTDTYRTESQLCKDIRGFKERLNKGVRYPLKARNKSPATIKTRTIV
jgi:hypothetical protein